MTNTHRVITAVAIPLITLTGWFLLTTRSHAAPAASCKAVGQGRLQAASDPDVQYASFHSDALGKDLNFSIQLPPSYAQDTNRRYPVLYFLHGMFGNEHEFERRGVAAAVDKMRTSGKIGDFILVSPAGDNSFYINAKGGARYEDAIVTDLVLYIESHYRAIGNRGGRAIQGISMGGFGALMIAFKHPDMFSSVTAHCAALFTELPKADGNDQRSMFMQRLLGKIFGDPPDEEFFQANNPIRLAQTNEKAIKKSGLKIYFDVGDQDRYGFQKTNPVLDEQLTKEGIAHEFHIFPGSHGWEYMLSVADHSYDFLWKNFSASTKAAAARK
ncbi:MAG: alpha/beta hydrolase [Blastocatellia bacterium]